MVFFRNLGVLMLAAAFATSCGSAFQLKKADKKFETGEYHAASEIYKRLYPRTPAINKALRAHIAFRMGESLRILNFNTAEQNYVNAIRNGYSDSIVFFRYAQVLLRNAKPQEAEKNFAIYLKKDSTSMAAKNGINASKVTEHLKKNPTPFTVKLFDQFNARRSHTFSPAYQSTDGDVLYFSSNRLISKQKQQKNSKITGFPLNSLYSSRKNAAGKWEKPTILNIENTDMPAADEGVLSFTADGNTMYFTRSRQQANSDSGTEIVFSNRAGGKWSAPKKVSIFADSTISVAHPAISPDGLTLVFVSDHKKGFGGKDLWIATNTNGTFTEIKNLGSSLNTDADEMFPQFRANGELYFASNGHAGLGGLDIFKATKTENDGWIIENMGMPINSTFDDFSIAFEGKNQKGFFTSNRNQARGFDLIYSFELPVFEYLLEGKVVDEKGTPIADALVRLVSNTGLNTKVQTKKDGTYRIRIDKDMECVLMANARGYLNKSSKISTAGIRQSKTFRQDFVLRTLFKAIQLENIFYEFGKWELTPNSETGLQALLNVLTDNPTITIELSAHTDYIGNNQANKTLSEKRAQAVVDYLIRNGISANRLTAVGYGEEKPVVVDAALAQKFPYLKENDLLTAEFVQQLNPTQQEETNQINRRTEFRVLKTTFK